MVEIILCELRDTDVSAWYRWFNDPEITDSMNKGAWPNAIEDQYEFLQKLRASRTDVQFAIVLGYPPNTLIGTIGIHKIDWVHRRGDVSVVIGDKEFWGKGVATEAIRLVVCHGFLKMNLRKLTAGMWDTNVGSRRAFEKNGFVLEGTLRENFHRRSSYEAEFRYGLLRSEWEKIQK